MSHLVNTFVHKFDENREDYNEAIYFIELVLLNYTVSTKSQKFTLLSL